jgi:hypothetical protein
MSASPVVPAQDTERVERLHSPPEPPTIDHRIALTRVQRIGVPLLALVPILAVAGVFDDRSVVVEREVGSLSVRAEMPQGVRQNRSGIVEIDLENRGASPVSAEVAISPEYLVDCMEIDMTPSPYRAWATRTEPIAPGERAQVRLEYEGERAGLHEGVLRIRESRGDEVRIPIRTFVFP